MKKDFSFVPVKCTVADRSGYGHVDRQITDIPLHVSTQCHEIKCRKHGTVHDRHVMDSEQINQQHKQIINQIACRVPDTRNYGKLQFLRSGMPEKQDKDHGLHGKYEYGCGFMVKYRKNSHTDKDKLYKIPGNDKPGAFLFIPVIGMQFSQEKSRPVHAHGTQSKKKRPLVNISRDAKKRCDDRPVSQRQADKHDSGSRSDKNSGLAVISVSGLFFSVQILYSPQMLHSRSEKKETDMDR